MPYELEEEDADRPFSGFGVVNIKARAEEGVFLLVLSRGGAITAAAYATESLAMEAALESLDDARDDEDDTRGPLEDRFARAQARLTDEGDALEIIPSPIYGA